MRRYDLLVAPVHLDPGYPLLSTIQAPRITHHLAVRMLLAGKTPRPMIEVTGARGKTTTAHAIAHGLEGPGVLLQRAPNPPGRSRHGPEGPPPPGTAPAPREPGFPAGPGIQVDGCNEEVVPPHGRLLRRYPLLPPVDVYRVCPVAGPLQVGGEVRSAMDGIEDEDLHGMVRGAP